MLSHMQLCFTCQVIPQPASSWLWYNLIVVDIDFSEPWSPYECLSTITNELVTQPGVVYKYGDQLLGLNKISFFFLVIILKKLLFTPPNILFFLNNYYSSFL